MKLPWKKDEYEKSETKLVKTKNFRKIFKNLYFAIIFIIALFAFSSSNLFKSIAVDLEITLTPRPEKNAIYLEWNADEVHNKSYKVWQKSPGATEFETVGTLNYDENETVKVLNVYPTGGNFAVNNVEFTFSDGSKQTLPKSASLKVWMEGGSMNEGGSITTFDNYGRNPETNQQLIKIDLKSSIEFNNNPEILKDYDVVVFGTWDANGGASAQPDANALKVIEEYIKSGKGILSGHDTIGYVYNNIGLSNLRKYFNIETGYDGYNLGSIPGIDYQQRWLYRSEYVEVVGNGFLTKFPWKLNKRLKIPNTHSNSNAALGKVWMRLVDFNLAENTGYPGKGVVDYYLTTYNNTAMIQTGHSSCQSTEDERKVFANTIFYLKQITSNNFVLDHSAVDLADPNPVSTDKSKYGFSGTKEGKTIFNFEDPGDNGSTYEYYVDNITDDIQSEHQTSTITTGVAGYAYILDNNPTNDSVGTEIQISDRSIDLGQLTLNQKYYLHVRAIDGAGNYSTVSDFEITLPEAKITITKKDSLSKANLQGVTFKVYEWNGSAYKTEGQTLTDNGDGTYTTDILIFSSENQGKFKIVEEEPAEHYYKADWSEEITLTTAGLNEYSYEVENTPYPKAIITINKTNEITRDKLPGIIFGLYEWDGNDYVRKETLKDNGNGTYTSSQIEYSDQNTGLFRVVEEQTLEHYYAPTWRKDITLTEPGLVNLSYDVTNKEHPRAVIKVNKKDSITKEILKGATFGVYEWNGSDYVRKSTLTDNNGTYTTEEIELSPENLGKFKIKEENPPKYYTNTVKDIEITLTEPGYHEYSYDVEDEPNKVQVKILKEDAETEGKIEGTTFTVYEWDVATESYKEYKRDGKTMTLSFQENDRSYLSEWLYSNKTNEGKFRIVETGTPEGYYGDWTDENKTAKKVNDIVITEENNGQEVVISNNEKGTYENKRVTGTINVSKIDKEKQRYETQGDATLNGAEYGLYAAETINHKDTETGKLYDEGNLVQKKVIANGTLKFDKVEIGNYYIKEIKAPEGYVLDETEYPIEIEYEGEEIDHIEKNLVLEEQVIKQAFKIEKLSINSANQKGSPLAGAGFKVYLISSLSKVKNGEITADGNENYTGEQFKEYNFEGEETAKYYEKNKETKILEEKTLEELFTDTEGHITTPELPYGKYVVIESTVPAERYVVDPIIVDIREDSREAQDYRYLLDEEFEALIKINKYDSTTKEKVLNKTAGYRIWDVNNERYVEQKIANLEGLTIGTEENPYRINEEGYIITPLEIQIGEYELEEVEAPEGYVKQGYEGKIENGVETKTPKEKVRFTVTEKGVYYQDTDLGCLVINVNQYNDPMVGELKVTKEGKKLVGIEEKENGTIDFKYEIKPIEGTQFEVYAKENIYTQDGQEELLYEKDEKVGDITTNTRGIGYVNNLPIGKYYVKEIEAGEGFTLNKSIKEFEIKYQGEEKATQSVTIDYVNEKQSIDINDNRGLIIEKVTDRVVYKPGEEVIYIIKVSNTGDIEASNIVVTENRINGEFIELDEEKIEQESEKVVIVKTLAPGESIELKYKTQLKELDEIDEKLEITNIVDAKGEVTVPDPDNPGEDKKEDVEAEDKKDIVVTDKKLVVVKEAVKDSYAPGETAQYLVKVVNNGTEEIRDIEVKETLLGGSFAGIEEARKNGIDVEYGKIESATEEGDETEETDYNKVIINKIGAKETVTLRYEYKVPTDQEGLKILGNTVKVTGKIVKENPDDPDHPIEEVVEDEISKDIEVKEDDNGLGIIKKDIETGERIEGAEIGLYAGEDIKTEEGIVLIEKDTLIEKTITNEQGKAIFTVNLPLGTYYAQEITAPRGYLLSTERIEIDLSYRGQDEETITISRVLTDRRRKVKIEKEDDEGKLLEGALLEVIDEDGNKIDEWETGKEGHIIEKLDREKVYTLREIRTVKGYTTAKEISFYIGEDEKLYQIEEGMSEGREVEYITMTDQKTKIKIEVKDKETGENVPGIEVDIVDKETGKVVDTVVTTEDGAEIEGLPVGDYELRIRDPENRGYVTDKKDIIIEDKLEEQKYEIEADYTKVEIGIKDEESDKLLPGGKIEVLDEEGNVVAEIETEEDMSKLDRLPPGKYTLHETEAPKGYWPSEDVEIEIRNTGEVQSFTLTNKRKIFDMSIEKRLVKQVYNGVETNITGELSKFEIRPQNIPGAEFWTIYTVTVRNVGEIAGKATVKEIIPDGFEMFQDSNLQWKVEGREATAVTEELEPGESQEFEVVLRWNQHVLNIGQKDNKAVITSTENELGFKDENEEDNNAVASILISLSTGLETYFENVMYVMLAIAIVGTLSIIIIKVHYSSIKKNK